MPTTSVFLLLTLVCSVAGMCFDYTKSSSPREVVKPAHIVGSIEDCKTACWNSVSCLAFSYNPISSKCALLGAVKEGICAGKGFYPYVKCAATVDCDYLSVKTVSFATSGGSSAFPRCQVKSDFVSTKVCDAPPPEIVCEHGQCFCKNTNQQLVVDTGFFTYCGVRAFCDGDNAYKLMSPNGKTLSLYFSMSYVVCTTIAQTTYDKCMCDMPLVSGGIRDGDILCGSKKMGPWWGPEERLQLTKLECTQDGWSDGQNIVKPQFVECVE